MQDAHDRMGGSMKPSSGHKEHHKKHKIKWGHFVKVGPAIDPKTLKKLQKKSHFERMLPKGK